MRLDAGSFRYLTKDDVRILTSVEMGLKNHEFVPEQLIESIAHLRRCGVFGRIQVLMKHGLLCHEGGRSEGYKLTYNGYDCLALRALTNRGVIASIGTRIGVGKESDIHVCRDDNDKAMVVKFHRLGRISFRAVKSKRDYLQGRSHASWLYLARLAAKKEYQYMEALYKAGFPVPRPIDNSRHAVLMEYMEGSVPLYQLPSELEAWEIETLLDQIFKVLLRFAACGLIHGDFNEFNLLVDLKDVRKVTVIDFPQIISIEHSEAQNQFERDVGCIERFFEKKFRIQVSGPSFEDAMGLFTASKDKALKIAVEGDAELLAGIADHKVVRQWVLDDEEQQSDVDGEEVEEEEMVSLTPEVDREGDEDDDEVNVDSEVDVDSEEDDSEDESSEEESAEEGIHKKERPPKSNAVIQDPRYVLKAKKRLERRNAPKVSVATPVSRAGQSHAKPNKQKRNTKSAAAREVKAWKTEGGW